MIRIDLLQRRKKRGWPALALIAVGLLAVGAGTAGIYWVDRHYPLHGAWKVPWGQEGEERVEESPPGEVLEEEPELIVLEGASEPTLDSETLGETRVAPEGGASEPTLDSETLGETRVAPAEGGPQVVPEEAAAPTERATAAPEEARQTGPSATREAAPGPVEKGLGEEVIVSPFTAQEIRERVLPVAPVDTTGSGVRAGQRPGPRARAVCLGVVQISQRLPASAQLTSLTCKSSGEYSLEGMSSSYQEVEDFLDTLQQLPSRAALSWWREGRPRPDQLTPIKFTFHGQCEEPYTRDLEPVPADQGNLLMEKIAAWAQQGGLAGVSFTPTEVALSSGRLQRRQKVWATGSYAQVGDFLRQLQQVEEIVALDEVVIVPVSQEEVYRDQARLYAVVDLLVHQP